MERTQVINFIKIGIVNTLFYYIIYTLALAGGVEYLYAALIATILGVLFNFKTFGKYVFFSEENKKIYLFILVYIFLYAINIFFIKIFSFIFNNFYLAGLLAVIPYSVFSFYLNKKIVFTKD